MDTFKGFEGLVNKEDEAALMDLFNGKIPDEIPDKT